MDSFVFLSLTCCGPSSSSDEISTEETTPRRRSSDALAAAGRRRNTRKKEACAPMFQILVLSAKYHGCNIWIYLLGYNLLHKLHDVSLVHFNWWVALFLGIWCSFLGYWSDGHMFLFYYFQLELDIELAYGQLRVAKQGVWPSKARWVGGYKPSVPQLTIKAKAEPKYYLRMSGISLRQIVPGKKSEAN